MLKVGVIGATGYSGEELLKILINHPEVDITICSAIVEETININEVFPDFKGKLDLIVDQYSIEEIAQKSDLVFLALPHRVSIKFVPELMRLGKKIIDISADYRLSDSYVYAQWYQLTHTDQENLEKAVYGLPEINREKIKKADLIANPGCYPTASILSALPALKNDLVQEEIIIDAKSGYSGAGRKPADDPFLKDALNNLKAYKPGEHQHMPEIEAILSKYANKRISALFVPHLIPMERGILSTVYLKLKNDLSEEKAHNIYAEFYRDEPFTKVLEQGLLPQTKKVVGTNLCQIGVKVNHERKALIVVSAIDNLIKGASGQAVQNMNIMYGFPETTALQ